jgi:hypothetical protein
MVTNHRKKMMQNTQELVDFYKREDLEEFAKYLGVDCEDYIEYLHPDVDFDDWSR